MSNLSNELQWWREERRALLSDTPVQQEKYKNSIAEAEKRLRLFSNLIIQRTTWLAEGGHLK